MIETPTQSLRQILAQAPSRTQIQALSANRAPSQPLPQAPLPARAQLQKPRLIASGMLRLKAELEASWRAGDLGRVAPVLEPGAAAFLCRNPVAPGERVLDLGCGTGQLAIPMARSGARVTGIDLVPGLVLQARRRAAEAGLEARFDKGDIERLPYADASFDRVVSFFGTMFAPRPWLATAEMLRVLRPGGRIVLASWTPEGFMGQMLQILDRFVPPSPHRPPPLLWGQEDCVQQRLGRWVSRLETSRHALPLSYPLAARRVVRHYRAEHGPIVRAFERLDPAGQAGLAAELEALWPRHKRASGDRTCVEAELLEVVAVKRS